jgi:hypothetical protein
MGIIDVKSWQTLFALKQRRFAQYPDWRGILLPERELRCVVEN